MPAFVAGNDDTFVVLCFGFMAFLCFLLCVEAAIRHKAYLAEINYTRQWIQTVLGLATKSPQKLQYGYDLLKENPEYTKKHIYPLWRRVLYRWRWVCWLITLVLFSMVAYQKLTFDPYAILKVDSNADEKVIKKAYRKLSKALHPDHNKEESAVQEYARVKKAYKMLTNPDDPDAALQDGTEDAGPGVALPSFMTDPNYAVYTTFLMLIILFAAPFAMLFWLKGRNAAPQYIPMVTELAQDMAQAEKFFSKLGCPRNELREYEAKERPRVTAVLQKLQAGGLIGIPRGELPFMPVDVSANFRPSICSVVQLKRLMMDVVFADPKKASSSEETLANDLCVFFMPQHKLSPAIQRIVKDIDVSAEDDAAYEKYAAQKAKGVDVDPEYKHTYPSDDDIQVVNYFLMPLLDRIIFTVAQLYPRMEGQGKELAGRLKQLYQGRLDHYKLLKKQLDERTAAGTTTITKLHRDQLAKSCEIDTGLDEFIYGLITEAKGRMRANMRKQKAEYERRVKEYERLQKKARNRSSS